MFSETLRFVSLNLQIFIIGLIISILTTVALKYLEGIVTIIINLGSYFLLLNFLTTTCEIIKDGTSTKSIKETFLRFDRENKDAIINVVILSLLLGAIIYIVTAPMIFISMTPFEATIKSFLLQNRILSILLSNMSFLVSAFYSVFFLISVASVIYFRRDTIESIKCGFKTTLKLKVLLLITLIVSAINFIPVPEESQKIIFYFEKCIDTVLNATILIVAFHYFKVLEQVRPEESRLNSAI